MAIDYRKEVDSGYDRKVMVEKLILELLNEGMPPEILAENPNFNIRHREMLHNLANGYEAKMEELESLYGNYDGLGESHSEVVHHLQELYPMTPEEEKEKFRKRDELNKKIEKCKNNELKSLKRKRETLLNKIVKLKLKRPIIDSLIEMVKEMDRYLELGPLNEEIMDELFKKYNFDKKNFALYNTIYKQYDEMLAEVSALSVEIEKAEQGSVVNDEIKGLIVEKNKIEEEIIQRNIKLVNYFIRSQYKNLLVEQEELFDICLIALSEAIRKYDVSLGCKFSTYAFKSMDIGVKKNFKNLTGYNWNVYWKRNKVTMMLEAASNLLGRKATIEDLADIGILDMSQTVAEGLVNRASVYLETYVYEELEEQKHYTTFEDYEKIDKYEDERYNDQDDFVEDPTAETAIELTIKSKIADVLETLTDRERITLTLRFGLDPYTTLTEEEREYLSGDLTSWIGKSHSLEDVAKVFKITRERVRQVEAKALRKLRHPARSRQFRDYL